MQVFTGMGSGVALGAVMHWVCGVESPVIKDTDAYLDIVGSGYVKLLQMIVIPLIMVSIVAAIVKLKDTAALGKISALTIGTLMLTTLVAAGVGTGMANLFELTAVGLTASAAEVAQGAVLQNSQASATAVTLPSVILSFIPANPFLDMTGARKTSTIAVVVFSIFIGLGTTSMALKKLAQFASFEGFVDVAQAVTIQVVKMVLRLTPYGVFALMAQVVAKTSTIDIDIEIEIVNLLSFVLASYSAILVMFGVHLALIAVVGLNPVQYLKKVLPLLVFAFTSRSSAAAIPMNIQTQTQALGTPTGTANFAASFGATMGQNGCAGIYPAMLAVMIAPTVGIDPYTFSLMAMLMAVVAIGSIGVAGVGGGATFAALIVLSAMNLPVALTGLLISIEPLIDMGRTALNVSGSATAGTVASRLMGQTDVAVFNSDARLDG
ncbi:MAG: L-cystine uptake protein TcyP (sodium:dicarboxylate symporter family) [Hydrogenophaga sp.]